MSNFEYINTLFSQLEKRRLISLYMKRALEKRFDSIQLAQNHRAPLLTHRALLPLISTRSSNRRRSSKKNFKKCVFEKGKQKSLRPSVKNQKNKNQLKIKEGKVCLRTAA